ncbi:MAG: hypothetical protein JOZ75_13435 [Candidatus Dormibacteraeota bacterium]|nr:hypothetical protein [Candidatus Dormibacteraeota bacterium]
MALTVYACVIGVRGPSLSTATFSYADAPEGAYLGSALLSSPTRLPLHTELVAGLFEAGLLRAPAAHLLIELLGPLFSVTAVALAGIAVRRLGGAWFLTVAVGLAFGPIALWSTLFPTAHGYTLLCLALLALSAVSMSRQRLLTWHALVVGVLCGAAVLSDQGFVAEGLAPLLVVVAMCRIRGDKRITRIAAQLFAVTAATIGVGAMLLALSGVHIVFSATPGASASNTTGSSVSTIVHTFSAMAAGSWYGADPAPPLGLLTSVAGLAIPFSAPTALLVNIRRSPGDVGRIAYLLFWASTDILILGLYVVLKYGGAPIEGHYLIPCLLSAIATFPLLVTPRLRTMAAILAAAVVAVQAGGVLIVPVSAFSGGDAREDARVLTVIRAEGLTRGYAGYWMSHHLTWLSDETVHVYPVQQRQCEDGIRVCPYEYSGDKWYEPVAGPTFLLLSSSDPCVVKAPTSLGRPIRTVAIDPQITLVVYDHDIARSFAHTPTYLC